MGKMSKITDSMDVTPYESPVLILDDDRVIYHPGTVFGWEYPGDDGVWMMGDKDGWQRFFDDLCESTIECLKSYGGHWDGKATAVNIDTYVSYYGDECLHRDNDWTWAEFSGSVLNLYDEHCLTKESQETDQDEDGDAIRCDNCNEIIADNKGYLVPETKNYYAVRLCSKCFHSTVMDDHFQELEEEERSKNERSTK